MMELQGKIIDLSRRIKGIGKLWAIFGIGLSSTIYVFSEKPVTVIDTGVGDMLNSLSRRFKNIDLRLSDVDIVILTHGHFDHIGGVMEIIEETSPYIFIHRGDSSSLRGLTINELNGGELIQSAQPLKVIHTPGHTGGSICLLIEDRGILFSGDTVFYGGFYGRTDLTGGSRVDMVNSLRRLSELRVECLLPGHGQLVFENADKHISRGTRES